MWLKKVIQRVKDEFLCCLHRKIKVVVIQGGQTQTMFMTRDELTFWRNHNMGLQLTSTNLDDNQLNWWSENWNKKGQTTNPDCLPYDPKMGF